MNVLISGASGFIGSAARQLLIDKGDRVISLSRSSKGDPQATAYWNPDTAVVDLSKLGTIDAAIHLSGENIAQRWTREKKAAIYDSRVKGTQLLSRALTALPQPAKVLICASAVGYYGNRGDEMLDESSPVGRGFLAELCRDWEAAADPAREAGVRVVHLRFGLVLAAEGGALAKMLPLFRLGLGGRLGGGKQWWSWITLADVLKIIDYALRGERLSGAFNAVSPNPVTNREFTKTLGAVLNRPTIFAVPAAAAKLVFGQMAEEALLASQRVVPGRLQDLGFSFQQPTLEAALRHVLG
jgi:uncharacterized protein (TIGR01777 family)